ncbi:MAG: type I DNA topoisomerase [Bacteroidales bacterium]|nr:type I DNA topoisomerase [Bacteroidales bacterium]
MKNLVIVESPAKAKTIEKFLGPDFTVMSSFGHIRDLKSRGMSIDIDNGFLPEYEIPAEKKDLVKKLKAAAKDADIVWLASDEDREGEAIAWHLYEVLGLKPENTRRIVFHEITKPAILKAIENPRSVDINLVNAQQARRVLDRLVGFELSPVLWKKIKPALSAGRVQSVAVRLICEREKEIKAFTPSPFWRINAVFISPDGVPFKAEAPKRFASREDALAFLEQCRDALFSVSDVSVKPVSRKPAPPFTTSTLQQEAGKKLGFSVSTTMRVAQSLYEAGHITYMRTDSTNLSEIALRDIASEITSLYGDNYLKTRRYHTNAKGAQEAHEAIRPTYISQRDIPGDAREKKLYALIWNRAMASQMTDALLEKTNIDIAVQPDSGADAPIPNAFHAEGETLRFEGFMKVYGFDVDPEDEHAELKKLHLSDASLLPPLSVGNSLSRDEITATERFTLPPARFSEASLVRKMEELGIGRPSTYAPTISTIQQRDYVVHGSHEGTPRDYDRLILNGDSIISETLSENAGSDKGRLVPTDVGMVVNDFLTEYFPDILDYNFTARVEEKFDEIAEGSLPWQNEMKEFYGSFHPFIDQVNSLRLERKVGERLLGVDPKSGRPVSVKIGRFGPVVQIGEASDEEKPLFASLSDGQSMSDITLDEALKLFDLPRTVGTFEDLPVTAAIGRFGPYILHNKVFVSIPKDLAPQTITLDEAVDLILKKREEAANRLIKVFPEFPGVEILRGRFGPYIAYKKEGAKKATNYKIPKSTDPESLSVDDVRQIIEKQDAAPARPARASRKKS